MEQKSKSTLALMEQAIMVLVFAFAAALCVTIFVKAQKLSQELADRDMAVNRCQTVAETVKATGGNMEKAAKMLGGTVSNDTILLYYRKDWAIVTESEAVYRLTLQCTEREGYLVKGEVTVVTTDGEEVFRLPVNWQKEVTHE